MGQSRSQGARPLEAGDGKASLREAGSNVKEPPERRDEWLRGAPKEPWDKSASGLKSDQQEWRESKGPDGQPQASNNSELTSRTGHQPGRQRR